MSFNTDEFNKKAKEFSDTYADERKALELCLETKANEDINFICSGPKEAYLKGVALTFCPTEYDYALRCQKDNAVEWASKCFTQNTNFGKCADSTLRRLYIYNLEHSKKNPANVPTPNGK